MVFALPLALSTTMFRRLFTTGNSFSGSRGNEDVIAAAPGSVRSVSRLAALSCLNFVARRSSNAGQCRGDARQSQVGTVKRPVAAPPCQLRQSPCRQESTEGAFQQREKFSCRYRAVCFWQRQATFARCNVNGHRRQRHFFPPAASILTARARSMRLT